MFASEQKVTTTVVCRKNGADAKNFTDGKRYLARKKGPGLKEGPTNTWTLQDDFGFDRVILIGVPCPHLTLWNGKRRHESRDQVVGVFEQAK